MVGFPGAAILPVVVGFSGATAVPVVADFPVLAVVPVVAGFPNVGFAPVVTGFTAFSGVDVVPIVDVDVTRSPVLMCLLAGGLAAVVEPIAADKK